jgi:hypothetical protein
VIVQLGGGFRDVLLQSLEDFMAFLCVHGAGILNGFWPAMLMKKTPCTAASLTLLCKKIVKVFCIKFELIHSLFLHQKVAP